ncbi:hypothetical protein CPB83DRAFT_904303 [Crepidotus variabilis]|uniref:Tetratricopeptide repeat protein 29 n=1 Tax=Crepidotus variabilis TaxID=179855 RepID=A0A9P6JTK3_9AGAR|nr:hypothetical protein CPB83DRAFT_904303 [Crepidotus variabilis]
MPNKDLPAKNAVVDEDVEEVVSGSESVDEEWEDQPSLSEALEAAGESITRLRDVNALCDDYDDVQTALNSLLDDANAMVEGLNNDKEGKLDDEVNEEEKALDLMNLAKCLDEVYDLVSALEDGNANLQISEALDCIRDCHTTIKGLASCSEESPEDNTASQPATLQFPDLPMHRFVGRSEILQLGVDHLCLTPASPSKVLITGENGSGKTTFALQLLHQDEVQATYENGLGCRYIDCAPFYGDGEQNSGGAGLLLAKAVLAAFQVELQPMEKDFLGFLYRELMVKGSKTNYLLVLDGLIDDAIPEEGNGSGLTLTVKKVVETMAAIHCVSLVVVTSQEMVRQMLSWSLVIPEEGNLGPLDLASAVEMFEELLQEELIKGQEENDEPVEMPDRDDIVELLQFQVANRLPLGIKFLAGMQKFHNDPLETCRHLEERIHATLKSPYSTSHAGLTPIFDTFLRSVVKKTKITRDAPRLMGLLAFLPEGLPNYKKVLPRLTSDEYLSFDVFEEPEASVEMLLKAALVETRPSASGVEALVVSQSVKQYFQIDPEENSLLANDLSILVYFIDCQRIDTSTPNLAIALGARNIQYLLNWYLKQNSSYNAADLAYKCSYMLSINRGILDEGVMGNIRSVYEGLLAETEARETEDGDDADAQQVDSDEARRRLVDFLLSYGRLLEHVNRAEQTRKVVREAIEIAETMEDDLRVGAALIIEGQASQLDDHHDESYASFQRASTIFEAHGSEEELNLARALHGMGYARRMKGFYEESRELEERACALCKQRGDTVFLGDALYGLGMTYKMTGRYDEALEKYEETRQLSLNSGNMTVAASTLNSMGQIFIIKDQPAEAMEKYQAAYQIFKQIQSQVGMARALDNIGEALREMGRFDEAIEKNKEAYTILKSFGDLLGMGNALDNWGMSLKRLERQEEAVTKFQEAVDIFQRAGLPRSRANALYHLGEVLFLLKQDYESASAFEESSSTFAMIGLDAWAAKAKWQAGLAYEFMGSVVLAGITYGQVYEAYKKMGYEDGMTSATDKIASLGAF